MKKVSLYIPIIIVFFFLFTVRAQAENIASTSPQASSSLAVATPKKIQKGVILDSTGKQCQPFEREEGSAKDTEGDWKDYFVGSMTELHTEYGDCLVHENDANDLKGCCLNLGFKFKENERLFKQGGHYLIKKDYSLAYTCNYFRLGLAFDKKNKECQVTYKQIEPAETYEPYKDEQKMFNCPFRPDKEAFWCSDQAYDFEVCNYKLDKAWQSFYAPERDPQKNHTLVTPSGTCDFSKEDGEACCRQILSSDRQQFSKREPWFGRRYLYYILGGGFLFLSLGFLGLRKFKNKKK